MSRISFTSNLRLNKELWFEFILSIRQGDLDDKTRIARLREIKIYSNRPLNPVYRKNPNNYHDIYFLMIEYQSTYSPKNVIHYLTVSARLSLRQFAHVLWIISPEICLHIIIQFNCIITKLTADYIIVLSPLFNDFMKKVWSLDLFAWILKSKWQIDSNGFRSMSSHMIWNILRFTS